MDDLARTAQLRALHTYLKKALKEKYAGIAAAHIANAEIAGLSAGARGTEAQLGKMGMSSIPAMPAMPAIPAFTSAVDVMRPVQGIPALAPQPQRRMSMQAAAAPAIQYQAGVPPIDDAAMQPSIDMGPSPQMTSLAPMRQQRQPQQQQYREPMQQQQYREPMQQQQYREPMQQQQYREPMQQQQYREPMQQQQYREPMQQQESPAMRLNRPYPQSQVYQHSQHLNRPPQSQEYQQHALMNRPPQPYQQPPQQERLVYKQHMDAVFEAAKNHTIPHHEFDRRLQLVSKYPMNPKILSRIQEARTMRENTLHKHGQLQPHHQGPGPLHLTNGKQHQQGGAPLHLTNGKQHQQGGAPLHLTNGKPHHQGPAPLHLTDGKPHHQGPGPQPLRITGSPSGSPSKIVGCKKLGVKAPPGTLCDPATKKILPQHLQPRALQPLRLGSPARAQKINKRNQGYLGDIRKIFANAKNPKVTQQQLDAEIQRMRAKYPGRMNVDQRLRQARDLHIKLRPQQQQGKPQQQKPQQQQQKPLARIVGCKRLGIKAQPGALCNSVTKKRLPIKQQPRRLQAERPGKRPSTKVNTRNPQYVGNMKAIFAAAKNPATARSVAERARALEAKYRGNSTAMARLQQAKRMAAGMERKAADQKQQQTRKQMGMQMHQQQMQKAAERKRKQQEEQKRAQAAKQQRQRQYEEQKRKQQKPLMITGPAAPRGAPRGAPKGAPKGMGGLPPQKKR